MKQRLRRVPSSFHWSVCQWHVWKSIFKEGKGSLIQYKEETQTFDKLQKAKRLDEICRSQQDIMLLSGRINSLQISKLSPHKPGQLHNQKIKQSVVWQETQERMRCHWKIKKGRHYLTSSLNTDKMRNGEMFPLAKPKCHTEILCFLRDYTDI